MTIIAHGRNAAVIKMIERANSYFKHNNIRSEYDDVFAVIESMLHAANVYRGFNWVEERNGVERLTGTDKRGYIQLF